MHVLSAQHRSEILRQLREEYFDLCVIGGGITGAGIALDAASRGLKVALIEKNDFASGTSSKSTKLIHGGLRYLKQFEIKLVREVGKERATVHRLAPHLVSAEKMLLPLVEGGTYGNLATSLGLWVYDVLAGVEGEDRRKMLSREATRQKEPMLRDDILKGGGFYAEYRTDDARLTIENIKTAAQYGAISCNYIKANGFHYDEQGQIDAVQGQDLLTDDTFQIRSKAVISAAGPWVDTLRQKDNSLRGKHLFLSKGVHIVVPHDRFPLKFSVYFDIPDGRMVFAIPRHRTTYIGTTDTPYKGNLNEVPINAEDVDYLIDAANHMFPSLQLTRDDVESSWAGLRPLIHEAGKSASEMSRKDEIFESASGLFSIAGGKLTGYRKMAERVVDRVAQRFQQQGRELKATHTHSIVLTGGTFRHEEEVQQYRNELMERMGTLGLPAVYAPYLVANYGKQTEQIFARMQEYGTASEENLAKAEAWYTIHHEIATTLLDFFNRRSGRLYFNMPSIPKVRDAVLGVFVEELGWGERRISEEIALLDREIRRLTVFEPTEAMIS